MSSIKKVLIIKVIAAIFCIAVGVVSFFLIADKLGNVDFHAYTINALDKSRSKVMELAAAAVASSSAITLLPGDVSIQLKRYFQSLRLNYFYSAWLYHLPSL